MTYDPPTRVRRAALERRRQALMQLLAGHGRRGLPVLMANQHDFNPYCLMCGRDWSMGTPQERLPNEALGRPQLASTVEMAVLVEPGMPAIPVVLVAR